MILLDMMTTIREYEILTTEGEDLRDHFTVITAKRILNETAAEFSMIANSIAASTPQELIFEHPMISNLREWILESAHTYHFAILSSLHNFELLRINPVDFILNNRNKAPFDYSPNNDHVLSEQLAIFKTFSNIFDAYDHIRL